MSEQVFRVPPIDEDAFEVTFPETLKREFQLSWDDPPDPHVLLDGEDITKRCAWMRLAPGGRATAGLFQIDSSGHAMVDGNVSIHEVTGRYKVRP